MRTRGPPTTSHAVSDRMARNSPLPRASIARINSTTVRSDGLSSLSVTHLFNPPAPLVVGLD